MWVCLNKGFVSIVEDFNDSRCVLVRGRRIEDVENFVGQGYRIVETPERDYRFRTSVTKMQVAAMLVHHVESIDYGNFKNSTKDDPLHKMYAEVWSSGVRNLDPDWSDRRALYEQPINRNRRR